MPKVIKVDFAKFHGLHNDFIVARSWGLPRAFPALAKAITDRHTGVGADGLLILSPPRGSRNHACLRFFNSDGSEAEMSGNGIRCAAAFLAGEKSTARELRIETLAGVKVVEQTGRKGSPGRWMFRVAMGAPIFEPDKIPFRTARHFYPLIAYPLRTSQGQVLATITSMGNPHCSIFVPGFARIDWRALGREIERLSVFPHRTNVEFVRVVSWHEIEVRYWERGAGETVSSGTGSCAAAIASILNGKAARNVRVRTTAGFLQVFWDTSDQVYLTGPAELVARGSYLYQSKRPL